MTPRVSTRKTRVTAGRAARAADDQRIAAIDIGSNSIRQIVADVSPTGAIRVVDEMKAAPRLGAGVEESGELSDTSMQSAVEALGRMAVLAKQLGCSRIEAVATSAVRDASNGATFLGLVRRHTGLRVRLLDGREEARLSFMSALAHFELGSGRVVVMDIGGGSLELVLAAEGIVERLFSLPFGAIRMTEQFLRGSGGRRNVRKLRRVVRDEIRDSVPLRDWRGAQCIGSGGTFTNLASMLVARQGTPTARSVHGTLVSRVDLEHLLDLLQDMTPAERLGVPGLSPARADIIVAGLAVAAETMARLDSRDLQVSAFGIREGLLLETARVTPSIADPGEARERSMLEFAQRCHYEEPHAHAVRDLALQLFDQIGARLGCQPEERSLLADAALLHDVGYHINYDKHHKHSYHLILHATLLGLSPDDQVVVANVARYHRGAPPKKSHRNFSALAKPLRRRITRLSALLRLADGLDRGHVGAVAGVKTRWGSKSLRVTVIAREGAGPLRLELWGASRKSELLSQEAGVPVELVAPDGEVLRYSEESVNEAD